MSRPYSVTAMPESSLTNRRIEDRVRAVDGSLHHDTAYAWRQASGKVTIYYDNSFITEGWGIVCLATIAALLYVQRETSSQLCCQCSFGASNT
jgi:hypothetical protein